MTEYAEKILNSFRKWTALNFDDSRIRFIFNQLALSMRKNCHECQADRLRCTFDPLCEDRRWLSLLIEIGAPRTYWPTFCFSRRKEEIKLFLLKRSIPTPMVDAKFPIKDLLSIFLKKLRKKKEELSELDLETSINLLMDVLKEKWKNIDYFSISKDKRVVLLDKHSVVLIFDLKRGIVTINSKKTGFDNDYEFIEFIKKMLELHELEYRLINPYESMYYVYIYLKNFSRDEINLDTFKKFPNIKFITSKNSLTAVYAITPSDLNPFLKSFDIDHFLELIKLIVRKE